MDINIYCSQAIPRIAQKEQTSPEAAEALALIRSIYDTGAPVHSKEAMRDVMQLLKSDSTEIRVRAIDGKYMYFKRESGQTIDADDNSENDWIIGDPFIGFWSMQEVMEHGQNYPPPLSLCSMWIYHYLIERNKLTGELLRPTPIQSSEEVAQFFELHRVAWEATEHCSRIRAMLSNTVKSRITKIIAFACGGMAYNDQLPWAVRSAYQHALILTIKDVLDKTRQDLASKVECYAQDPVYRDYDCDVLARHGIKTLESSEGFLEVDDSTVVLSFSPDIAVRQIIADIACPAMMIWNESRSNDFTSDISEDSRRPFTSNTDPDSPRLNKLLKNFYEEFIFPGDLDAFKGMAVFVKKDDCPLTRTLPA